MGAATAASPLVRKIALPNSGWITNVYDGLGRLAETSLRSSTNVVLNQHQYQYSGHLRSKMTRTDGSYQDYTHDGADQLKTALTYTSGGTPIGGENRGYVYDAAGNLNTRTNNAAVQSFGVDSVNQLNSSPVGTGQQLPFPPSRHAGWLSFASSQAQPSKPDWRRVCGCGPRP